MKNVELRARFDLRIRPRFSTKRRPPCPVRHPPRARRNGRVSRAWPPCRAAAPHLPTPCQCASQRLCALLNGHPAFLTRLPTPSATPAPLSALQSERSPWTGSGAPWPTTKQHRAAPTNLVLLFLASRCSSAPSPRSRGRL